MSKRITKATAKAAVRRHAANIDPRHVEIDGDCVALFCESLETDLSLDEDELGEAASKIAAHCGGCAVTGNGSAWFVWFKRAPVTFGHDFNDKASPHHW